MDKELLELLNSAKNQGASKEQLIQIRDNYNLKKKGKTEPQQNIQKPSETTELVSQEPKQNGASVSQKDSFNVPTAEEAGFETEVAPAIEEEVEPINDKAQADKARSIRPVGRDNTQIEGFVKGDSEGSSVLMATETFDGKNWVSFPTLFPKDPENPTKNPNDWIEIADKQEAFKEAEKRGEVFEFGEDKDKALAFGEGSWKISKAKTSSDTAWKERVSTGTFTDDFTSILNDPLAFKKEFIESRDYTPDKENGQDFLDDQARRRAFARRKRPVGEAFEQEIKEREEGKFNQQRQNSEKEYTGAVLSQIKENDGDIKFLSTEQLGALNLNPMFVPTGAIKIDGKNTSIIEMNELLLDGNFVSDLKEGKINVEIDKENELIKKGFISKEGVVEAEKLLERQRESGNRFIDLGEHLVKSVVQLPSGILKLPTGVSDEFDVKNSPATKVALSLLGFNYDHSAEAIIATDKVAEAIEERTQIYGDGISKSIKKGNFADAGFQVANAGFEMTPLIAVSMIAPQAAPALFGAQAAGEKITGLQQEQKLAQEQLDNGYVLSKEELNAVKYSSLQKLGNAGATGLLNYVLFGGYIKGIAAAGKIESYAGKSLLDLKKASQLGYGQGFVNFGKEVVHQQKFFAKMNIGNEAIDRITNTTSHVTGETVIDDAIKGLAFAVPFHASKTYNKNKGLKKAKGVLVKNLLATSKYGKEEFQRLEDINSVLEKLRDTNISEETRVELQTTLGVLNEQAELSHQNNLKDIDKLSETQKEDFAIRYEKLIERQKAIDELDKNSPSAKPVQERLLTDKEIYDKDFEEAITGKKITNTDAKTDNTEAQPVNTEGKTIEGPSKPQTFEELIAKGELPEVKEEAKKETIEATINRPVTLTEQGGSKLETPIEGDMYLDGKTVVIEDANGNIFEIGNIDQIGAKDIAELGVVLEKSTIAIEGENITYKGEAVIPSTNNPLSSIKTNRKGEVNRVVLKSPDGKKTFTLRKQEAEDAAYEILILEAEKNGELTERKLSQNETLKNELRKIEDVAEKNADKDTERSVTTETKKEPVSETTPKTDTKPNADVRPSVKPSVSKGKDSSSQPTPKSGTGKKEVEIKEPVYESRSRTFTAKVVDGELVVAPVFGTKKPSARQAKEVAEQYAEQTNFDKGKKAEFQEGMNPQEAREVVLEESQNPKEIAEALQQEKESNSIQKQEPTISKEEAISQALFKFKISKEDSGIRDLSFAYTNGKTKQKAGSLDKIVEQAQIVLNDANKRETDARDTSSADFESETIIQKGDIERFIQKYKSSSDYRSENPIEKVTNRETELADKFKELTGLKPTPENIEKITGKKTQPKQEKQREQDSENIKDDEVPFQAESSQVKTTAREQKDLVDTLEKTGLAKEVKIISEKAIKDNLKRLGREGEESPLGFVDGETVYINADKAKADTPIHEFGHLWAKHTKENNNAHYQMGLALVEGTPYHEAVKQHPAYRNKSEEVQLNEALSQAIGERGVEINKESKNYPKFQAWFKKLFADIQKGLGFKEMSGDKLSKMSIKDFTRQVAGELLSGKKQGKNTVKNVKSKVESKEITGIEFLMEQQKAVTKVKDRLSESIKDKKAENKDVKEAFLGYLNETLKRKGLEKIQIGQLTSLLRLYEKTVTEPKLNDAIKRIDEISNRLDQKEYKDHIGKLKTRAIAVETARNKRKSKSEKRKAATEYLRQSVKDKKYFTTATANDVLAISRAIESNNTEKAIEMIDEVAVRLEKKYNFVVARNETKKRIAEDRLGKLKQRILDEKNKFRDQKKNFANKKKEVEEVKKAVLDYINDSFDNNLLGEIKKREFTGITKETKVENIEQLQESLNKIDNIVLTLQNKTVAKEIAKLLDKGKDTKQSGKIIGKKGGVSQEAANILKNIKKETKTAKSNKKAERENILKDKLDEISDKIEDLNNSHVNGVITIENQAKLNALEISEKIIRAELATDPLVENFLRESVKNELEFIVEEGKSSLAIEREVQTSKLDGEQIEVIPEVDANNSRDTEAWNDTMDNIKRKFNKRNIISKKTAKLFINPLYSNLATIRKQISQRPNVGTAIKGFQRIIVDTDFAEINMNQINENWGNEINSIKSKVFKGFIPSRKLTLKLGRIGTVKVNIGARTKADFALSEPITVTVKTPEGTAKESFSASVLLDVWLKSKNPNNREGLDKTGFTAETIAEIESKLSDKVKQYGEEVMEWYKSKYKEVNAVYRKMYYRDLPFDEFYSGKLNVSGVDPLADVSMFEGVHSFGTTAGGSLKAKTQHGKAITPSNVDSNLGNYITQMSKFIAYAEVHRRLNKTLNNQDFQKAVLMNNKGKGGDLLDQLKAFKARHIEKTKVHETSRAINFFNRNYVTFTLGGKLKQVPIQMVSAINGQFALPKGLTAKEWAIAHANIPKDALYIFENSSLIKQRLNTKQAIKAFSSIDDAYSYTNNMTKNDRVNLMFRLLGNAADGARAAGMTPIKVGDMIGVSGQIPVFGAAKIKIRKENPSWSEVKVAKEALLVFEDSVNRTQQGQTKGVKSYVQNHPMLKLLINFKTTPILNINESWIALNDMKKGKDSEKSKAQNIATIINFGILQNSLYTLINTSSTLAKVTILKGSFELLKALFDDEDNKEQLKQFSEVEKDLLFSTLGGQFIDGMYLGALKTFVDIQILKKDFSFGTTLPIVLKEEMNKFDKNQRTYLTTDNPTIKRKAGQKMVSSMVAIFSGLPPKAILEYFQYHAIIDGENVFNKEEAEKLRAGHSFSSVNNAREERTGIKIKDLLTIDAEGEDVNFSESEVKKAEESQKLLKLKNEAKEKIKSGKEYFKNEDDLEALGITPKWQEDNYNLNAIKAEKEKAERDIKRGKLYITDEKELIRLKITEEWQEKNAPQQ